MTGTRAAARGPGGGAGASSTAAKLEDDLAVDELAGPDEADVRVIVGELIGDREVRECLRRGAVTGEERVEQLWRQRDEIESARSDRLDGRTLEVSAEVLSGEPCDLVERARLFEEMRGPRHDDELVWGGEPRLGLAIEAEHLAIERSDDEEHWRGYER